MVQSTDTANEVIIVGAGASGLLAANILVKQGLNVTLIEKMHQAGLKLRITGKGHCNITNACEKENFIKQISNPEFFKYSFEAFDNKALMSFFENKGCELVVERGNRVYPKSKKSLDVFLTLLQDIEGKSNFHFEKNQQVKDIILKGDKVIGVRTNKKLFFADNVIMCVGGMTYPQTGSTGDGYEILSRYKISIRQPIPILTGLITRDGYSKDLQDLEIKNCQVNITNSKKETICSNFGDIYLDEYGVSGPAILTVSRDIARILYSGEKLYLTVDLKPKLDKDKLYEEILRTFSDRRAENALYIARKWFIRPIALEALRTCKINPRTIGHKLKERDAKQLLWYMKNRKQEIIGDFGWKESIITMGGVELKEVNYKTLQTNRIKHLYISGELLDLDAPTGGYNLQIAFSTGYLAAKSIIQSI